MEGIDASGGMGWEGILAADAGSMKLSVGRARRLSLGI